MAEAAAPSTGGAPPGSPSTELSKPIGVNDDAVWNKHFGKDAKSPPKSEPPKPKAKSEDSKESKPPKAEAKPPKSDKDKSDKADAAKADAKAESKKADKAPAKDQPRAEKAKPGSEVKESAGGSAPTAEESDPGSAPAKAKDLYAQAKQAADPREGRKLYKQAMEAAFGEVPPEFSDASWRAAREKRASDQAKLDAQAKHNEGRIDQAVRELQPAIAVMRKLNEAKLGDKLTMPMVERSIEVLRALRELEAGDFTSLGDLISKASGKPPDEAMKLFVRGVKVSPEGRALRATALAAEQRAAEAEKRIADMEKKLQERDELRSQAERQAQASERRAAYLEEIESDLDGHPVLQLPRGKERVLKLLVKTADRVLKTPRYSFEEAADKVVAYEKKRLQRIKFLDGDAAEAPQNGASGARVRTVPRGETAESGVTNASAEARFSAIFDKHTKGGRR